MIIHLIGQLSSGLILDPRILELSNVSVRGVLGTHVHVDQCISAWSSRKAR